MEKTHQPLPIAIGITRGYSTIAMKKRISSKNISQLFELHLRPTLKEYLRAAYPERELDDKLQEALKTFVEHI